MQVERVPVDGCEARYNNNSIIYKNNIVLLLLSTQRQQNSSQNPSQTQNTTYQYQKQNGEAHADANIATRDAIHRTKSQRKTSPMEGVCCNCHRVLWVEGGEEVLDELGRRFCGQNCLWSVLLDGGHRRARLQQHALVRTLTMPDDALVQNLNQQPALPNAHENTARRNHPRSHHPHNPSVDPAHGHLRRFRHDMNHDMEPCDDLLDDPCRHALSRNHSLQPLEKKKANAYESALGGLPVRGRMDIPLSPIHEDGFGDDSQNAMFAFHRINYPVNSVRGR